MREFRPPATPSLVRLVLGIALPLLVLLPLGGIAGTVLGFSPATYTLGDGELVIKSGDFFAGTRTVKLGDITAASVVSLRGGRRTSGTALPGFCAGHFSYPELGGVWQVTTCSATGVLIRAANAEPILLSPPDSEEFLDALRNGARREITLPVADRGPVLVTVLVVALFAVLGALGVSAVLLIGPSRMVYRVAGGNLEVETLFGKQSWGTRDSRARMYTPERLWRIAGTAAPGYYTGRFRESGQATRVYATKLKDVLLFEAAGARVILSPEDGAGMLQALAKEGATIPKE